MYETKLLIRSYIILCLRNYSANSPILSHCISTRWRQFFYRMNLTVYSGHIFTNTL